MRSRRPLLAVALLASLALLSLPAPAGAAQPWWQVLSGSRPSNLQVAPDQSEVQELTATKVNLSGFGQVFAARLEINGELIGCLGSGAVADGLCEVNTEGLFTATETAEELEELLEGAYGGEVEVSGGPAGDAKFEILTPDRWVAPLEAEIGTLELEPGKTVNLGSVSSKVTSQGSGRLVATLTNLGNAPLDATSTPLVVTDRLPEGASAYGVQTEAGGQGTAGPLDCRIEAPRLVSCSFEDELPPYEAIVVEVLLALAPGAGEGEGGEITVSGGDGPAESIAQALNVSAQPVPFGLEHFSMAAESEGGKETAQAGTHPFQLTTTIVAKAGAQSDTIRREARVAQPALPRNLSFTLPAGLVGDATAVETCEMATFLAPNGRLTNDCPDEAAIGVASVTVFDPLLLGLARLAVPVFNLPPARGEPARFGLVVAGVPVVIDTSVDPSDSYRITAAVRNIPQVAQFLSSTTTIWGDPGSPAHDGSRGWNCAYFGAEDEPGECTVPANRDESPFLRMPASCKERLRYDAAFEPWNVPVGSAVDRAGAESAEPLRGCNRVPFDPAVASTLTSRLTANPSGQDFGLTQPGAGFGNSPVDTPEGQAKRIEVTLPEGVTLNPSAAEGLATCSEADYDAERFDSAAGEGCPGASKVGTLEASTPLIDEKLEGELFVAEPYENPTGELIAVYLVVRSPGRGILVRQALAGNPDERSGRLVFTATDAPPLPYTSLRLHLREGARAPLITPPGCGTFHTVAKFVPWSAQDPDDPDPDEIVTRTAPFVIERGVNGGACPQGEAPFAPGFQAGTLNNQAGSYSPFAMRITRGDGMQDLSRFSATLPAGVVGKLAGVPWCPEAGIARAKARTGAHGGREERRDPSCPAAGLLGRTVAGAGVGNQLTYVGGSLYLAGPYKGAPLSVVAITPAVAGPFDAGTVVVRVGLRLNPVSGVVEVDGAASDPIPHILKGIPLSVRDLRVYTDRPDFTLNATSCAEEQTFATLWGAGTVIDPRPASPVARAARYQAAGCRGLGFSPRLAVKLKGGVKRGRFPALRAHYKPKAGDANLRRLALTFPSSAFIEQGHFRTICTRVRFAAGPGHGALCPKGATYGRARVWTPLLDEPLTGPVILRSSDHNLPDAVFALRGPPTAAIEIEVAVRIDSVNGRLRATVEKAPDAPVSRAIVDMQGGRKGLIVNSRHLCHKPGRNRARANLRAQNGRLNKTKPIVRALRCAKRKRKAKRARVSGARALPGGKR